MPDAETGDHYCIIEKTYETAIKSDLEAVQPGLYAELHAEATENLGRRPGKALIARYMARKLIARDIVPQTVRAILDAVNRLVTPTGQRFTQPAGEDVEDFPWDDDIPF